VPTKKAFAAAILVVGSANTLVPVMWNRSNGIFAFDSMSNRNSHSRWHFAKLARPYLISRVAD
jgi:hypothetical protein